MNTTRTAPPRTRPRGFAALTVVMVLFFVMALVAAYTNRNLIFEQRISANNYRATRALAAADAGVDWTLAMLNSGRIGLDCRPSVDPANTDFRSRYLRYNDPAEAVANGGYLVVNSGPGTPLYPACINRNGVLNCTCPTATNSAPGNLAAAADGVGSTHRISFVLPGNNVWPGALQFIALGCATPGSGATSCFAPSAARPAVDALISTLSTVGLMRALPIAPKATLTAGGAINADLGELRVSNGDASSGLTAHAGQGITGPSSVFSGPAGSGSDGRLPADAPLAALAAAPNDGWFQAMFGTDRANYQRQPAVVHVNCNGGCTLADLANVLAGHPRNPIWVDGNLTMGTAAALGTAADPLMLIVNGALTLSADVDITGFVHATTVTWSAGADAASLTGALVTEGNFTASAVATLAYDRAVLDVIRLRYGSFVRMPASWNLISRVN